LFLYSSGAVLKGNGVEGNVASTASDGVGGGLHFNDCRATLIENRILENTASTAGSGEGGGLRFVKCTNCEGASVLIGNIVRGNVASTVDHGLAGGVQIGEGTLIGNAIVSNTATLSPTAYGTGGGLVGNGGRVLTLTNNLVTDNHATEEGSGMHIMGDTSGRLLHNTIVNNHGGASGVEVGGGLAPAYTTLMFTNTIIAGHANLGIRARQGNTVALEATLWGSGAWANGEDWGGPGTIIGAHSYWGDPAFVDPAAGDYHIRAGSDARDAGVDAGVTTDIDGESRPMGLGYDIGADECPVALTVTKRAHPDPVGAGNPLTYTIRVTNTGNVDLHAIVTDTLPAHVTPSGTFTWTPTIPAPGGAWTETVIVTAEEGYTGPLTNTVHVATEEGASGTQVVVSEAEAVSSYVYLPLVLRGH
jgi:uncharacterized repeat protein (TIGR01451 family)